jgi:hypothetical protein
MQANTNTTKTRWIDRTDVASAMREYPRNRVPEDGKTTCLWHRQHEFYLASLVPLLPACYVCGGPTQPDTERHELCRLRHASELPTPPLSSIKKCPCTNCAKAAKVPQ